jgi:hypothetical protein
MALASRIQFSTVFEFISFWHRNKPDTRGRLQHIVIPTPQATDMQRVPEELQKHCARLEGECNGLQLKTLTLVIGAWSESSGSLLLWRGTIRALAKPKGIDEIRIFTLFPDQMIFFMEYFADLGESARAGRDDQWWIPGFYVDIDNCCIGFRFVRKEALAQVLGVARGISDVELERIFGNRSHMILESMGNAIGTRRTISKDSLSQAIWNYMGTPEN